MAIARRNVCLFVCLFSWGDESKSLTGSARKLGQSPLPVGHSEAAMTGILKGFSLRICVHLRLHTPLPRSAIEVQTPELEIF